ncbi:hypothetical protein [Labrys neptuniae]
MKIRLLASLLLFLGLVTGALAQSSPGWIYGQVPNASAWNGAFAAKQDFLGFTPVNRAGDTMSGPLTAVAPTGAPAGFVLTPGSTPSAPANGSLWVTSTGFYVRVNGTTLGPLGSGIISPLRMPALTGDVTSTAGTTTTTISPGVVTAAKMASGAAVGNIGYTPLNAASNLSDVASAPTAWTNLGGGSIGKLSSVSLTANVSNTLPVGNGGTGATTLTANGILLGAGTSAVMPTAAMTNGQILVGQTSAAPLPKTVSGDCALAASGAATCTQLNGVAPGTAYPLNVGTSANNVVQLNGSARLPAVDGSQLINLPPGVNVPKRQVALYGPATNGLPSFLPATSASLTLTTQNISTGANALVVTAANGFGANGATNVVGIATANFSWTLTASVTNYLCETVSAGALSPCLTTTKPIYQYGGTISTTNGQYTFDIVAMQMYLGNGSVANPVNTVFVGEAVAGASSITSTTAYAYQAYFRYLDTNSFPAVGTVTSGFHNIGTDVGVRGSLGAVCAVTELGYPVGSAQEPIQGGTTTQYNYPITPLRVNGNAYAFTTANNVSLLLANASTGTGMSGATLANWRYRVTVWRDW